jgi:hypothetical protein
MNDDPRDPEVQRALQDAVSDVRPHGGLDTIMARIEDERPRRTSSLTLVLATAAVMVLILGGIAFLNRNNQPDTPPPTDAGPRNPAVEVFYTAPTPSGLRVFSESHRLDNVTTSDVQAAVSEALGKPLDPDYGTLFPHGTVAEVTDNGNTVDVTLSGVNLSELPAGATDADAANALQAIVYTVDAALQRPAPVTFKDKFEASATILGQNVDQPVARASEDSVLSPVSMDLQENTILPSGSVIQGQAAAFEANVQWQLKQGDKVVRHGFTTARECCTLAPYDFVLKAPPGHYTLVVSDTDPSGGEGRGVTSDSKDITIE